MEPLVIDVGANAGVFAHRVFCLNRAASLLAVEPQPYLTEKVLIPYARKQNVKMQVVQAACSDRDGSAELCFNQVGEGTASLQGRDGVCSQSVRVPLVTLDRIAPSGEIQLLKIDTEGHDVMVLAGAKSVLERVSFLIVELRSANEVAMAAALLGPCWDRVRLSASDSLFVRRK
jgi:FkbM family methyltransferase